MDKDNKDFINWDTVINFIENGNPKAKITISKTEAEWRAQLTPEVFYVTRQKGTEPAFSSEMCSLFDAGLYACACCNTKLFNADEKFESETGWPSFTQPIEISAIAYHEDFSFGMERIETTCNTCGAHLGHVFSDGPEPTGLRYCMNALSLQKVEEVRMAEVQVQEASSSSKEETI